ncbi:MAG: hypothetical protein WBD63_02565, partial [Phycisphaerae bacterium]
VKGAPGNLAVRKRYVYNTTLRTFEETRFEGEPAIHWRTHHLQAIAALLGQKRPTQHLREFCACHSFYVVSEVPHLTLPRFMYQGE